MGSDTFERVLKVHLEELQGRLSWEHRLVSQQLQAKVTSLEEENARLRRQSVQHVDLVPSDRPPVLPKQAGPTLLLQRREEGDASCCRPRARTVCIDPSCGETEEERHSASPGPGAGRTPHFAPVVPGTPATSPAEPIEATCAAVDRRCAQGAGGLARGSLSSDVTVASTVDESFEGREGRNCNQHFKVLDIWERPRLRMQNSRKISLHSIDRLSSVSGSTMFGNDSENSDDQETIQHSAQRRLEACLQRLMLPPSSLRYLVWEIMGLFLVAYDIVVIPLQILRMPETPFTSVTAWLIRFFWTFDVLISFLTGYVSPQGFVEMRPAKVAKQYIHSRLGFDLILVSCDWTEAFIMAIGGGKGGKDASALRLLGMLRAIRLIRLVRLAKSQKISEFIFEHIRSEGVMLVTYIIAIMVMLLSLIHVIACIWHGIRRGDGNGEDFAEQYVESFHYVLSLFAGEQVLDPQNLLERLFTILVLVFAFVVSAAFVGSLTTAMTRLQIIASKRSTQFAALNRYLSDYGISRDLAARVQRNARHALTEQKRHTPESSVELMLLISDPLRAEIHYEVFSPILTAHPFYHLYNWVNPVGVRHICHSAVATISLSRGDVIFSEFELPVAPRMFFVVSGRLNYQRGLESQQTVVPKQWLAEAVLWTRWAHRGTLRAITESRLLAVDAHRVSAIMSTFPTYHGINYAVKFVDGLNEACRSGELTDISDGEERARHLAASVFQELDRALDVPADWRLVRSSKLSVSSLASSRRLSIRSSLRSSVLSVGPR